MFLLVGLILALMVSSITVVGLALYFLKYKYMIDVTQNIASPPSLPILGHGHHFIGLRPEHMVRKMEEFYAKHGDTFKVWLGPQLNIMFGNVKDVEVILSKTKFNDKAMHYSTLKPWLNEGLLISRGKKWFQRRKVITPAFHFKILDQFIEVFDRESRILIKNLEKELKMQSENGFNLYDWINLCTLDTICESAMGISTNAQKNIDSNYVQAVKTISTVLHKRMFDLVYRFEFIYKFTNLAKQEAHALAILHGFTEKIITQRREELLKAQEEDQKITNDHLTSSSNVDVVGVRKKLAFLDMLLQTEIDGKPLSNLDIREEVDTFMFEGHDTTSSAILFFFYNVATNPKCQQKCFEELYSIFGKDKDKPITFEDLNRLNYTELCIKETLRLFPSVPLLGRKVSEECEINGKIIPAGTNIGISPLHLGRMEKLFPQPNDFIPERFDVVSSAEKMNPYAYIPFSAGPRNCIGQKFAILEMKSIIANVLRNFAVEYIDDPTNEQGLIAELILRPKDPIMFKIKARVYPE